MTGKGIVLVSLLVAASILVWLNPELYPLLDAWKSSISEQAQPWIDHGPCGIHELVQDPNLGKQALLIVIGSFLFIGTVYLLARAILHFVYEALPDARKERQADTGEAFEIEWVPQLVFEAKWTEQRSFTLGEIALLANGTVVLGNQAFAPKDAIDFMFAGHHATRARGQKELQITTPDGETYWFYYQWIFFDAAWHRLYPRRKPLPKKRCLAFRVFWVLLKVVGFCLLVLLGMLAGMTEGDSNSRRSSSKRPEGGR